MGCEKRPTVETPVLDRIDHPRSLKRLSDKQLQQLAEELRLDTIEKVSQTGGHLGSTLGVVELTVALHAVFDTPTDKLIWDVGHQAYAHKILTGRRQAMNTLRKEGGISGFTKRSESEYDPFGAAHSSTSISAGLGFAVGRDLQGTEGDVVSIIGDGAMSAGMAYEAMNHAGELKKRQFVILNDNQMSISPSVGALSTHMSMLCKTLPLVELHELLSDMAKFLPEPLREGLRQGKRAALALTGNGSFFEHLGFNYIGPVDGHDLPTLLTLLRSLKQHTKGPVLIHAITRKGAGYQPAETSADKYHGVSSFDASTGTLKKATAAAPSYTSVFAEALIDEARKDSRIVGITAAMASGTGIDKFAKEFPKRTFDVGIAEQHGVTFAAGLAVSGMKPFCAIYSTFLQRAYDQIVHDVALQELPVRFAIDRAGLVGADGPTHAGAFDISYLSNLPGFTIMAAADESELVRMIATAAIHDSGPIAFRYPRGEATGCAMPKDPEPLKIGKGRIVQDGATVALLSLGTRLGECQLASLELEKIGLKPTIADARFAKPLDLTLIEQLARDHDVLITVEEGAIGGFGTQVLHHLCDADLLGHGLKVKTLMLPDTFIPQASPERMYEQAGLNSKNIVATAMGLLWQDIKAVQPHLHVASVNRL